MKKDLVILLCGNAETVISKNMLDKDQLIIIKEDEKILSKPKKLKSIIKSNPHDKLYFATIEMSYQRFKTFIKIYALLFFESKTTIIDELGQQEKYTISKLLLKELPLLLIESILSAYMIIKWYFKLKFRLGEK